MIRSERNLTVLLDVNGRKSPVRLSAEEFARLQQAIEEGPDRVARVSADLVYWDHVRGRDDSV
jgi:hypothetical protein